MSRFLKLERLDPFAVFATVVERSRLAMSNAYDAAFAAHERCSKALRDYQWGSHPRADVLGFPVFGGEGAPNDSSIDEELLNCLWLDGLAEDFQCDQQAAPVILVADDTLQRFAKAVLPIAPGLANGFGPRYGGFGGASVPLTSLLRAATNAIRHVSEWDDNPDLPFPYPAPTDVGKSSRAFQALQSIHVIQRAFGIGRHERIRDVVSMRVLVAVDGGLGTRPPDYLRFEAAMIDAACEIAAKSAGDAHDRLLAALRRTSSLEK